MSFANINSSRVYCSSDHQFFVLIGFVPRPAVRQLCSFNRFADIGHVHLTAREVRRIACLFDVQRDSHFCRFIVFGILRRKDYRICRLITVCNIRLDCGIFPCKGSAYGSSGHAMLRRSTF